MQGAKTGMRIQANIGKRRRELDPMSGLRELGRGFGTSQVAAMDKQCRVRWETRLALQDFITIGKACAARLITAHRPQAIEFTRSRRADQELHAGPRGAALRRGDAV